MWYMHDGVPAHFNRNVRDIPSNTFHGRRRGRGRSTVWSPRSTPGWNPLNFYLRRHLKPYVHAALADKEEIHRTVDACQNNRNYPGICERKRGSMMRRPEVCIGSHGGHLENLL